MYRQKKVTADDIKTNLHLKIEDAGVPSLPIENNYSQPMRPKGDPASIQWSQYQVTAGFYERHTRAFE